MIELLAMSPSGEVYFTRDRNGFIWRHRRLGLHETIQVSMSTVDWTITHHGYDRCDDTFATLVEAENYVVSKIPTSIVNPADLPVNITIARSAVRVMERWLESPTDVALVIPTVNRLLANDTVCADTELKRALLSLSDRATGVAGSKQVAPLLRNSSLKKQVGPAGAPRFTDPAGPSRFETMRAMFDMAA